MNRSWSSPSQRQRQTERELDAELLGMIARHRQPVTLAKVFQVKDDDLIPRWACESVDRLLIGGRVRECGGRLEVVPLEGERLKG